MENIILKLMDKLEKKIDIWFVEIKEDFKDFKNVVKKDFTEIKEDFKDFKNEVKKDFAEKYVEDKVEKQWEKIRKLEDWQLKAITLASILATILGYVLNKFL